MRIGLVPALVSLALFGCGDEAASLSLEVRDVDLSPDLDASTPFEDGRLPVLVTVGVTNRSNGQTLLAPAFFSVETSGGVEVLGSDFTQLVDEGCRADLAVPEGRTVDCALVFALPEDDWPTRLLYSNDSGRYSTAVEPCPGQTICDRSCVDTLTDLTHCGACFAQVPAGSDCVDGIPTCEGGSRELCGDVCADLSSSPDHCGSCGTEAPAGTSCVDSAVVCDDPSRSWCGNDCVDTQTNTAHCGGCDQPVQNGEFCIDGSSSPCGPGLDSCGGECVDLGSNSAHCGGCNSPVADGASCQNGSPRCEDSSLDICGAPASCIDLDASVSHCGQCDRSCPGDGECDEGSRCVVDIIDDEIGSCDDLCAGLGGGYTCVQASRYCSEEKDFLRPCDVVADPIEEGCSRRCICEHAFN